MNDRKNNEIHHVRKTNESQHSAVKYLVLLMQGLLPEMRELSDFFTFQQDSAPAHRVRPTVELLENEVPDFISPSLWPPNSIVAVWEAVDQRVIDAAIRQWRDSFIINKIICCRLHDRSPYGPATMG